MINKDFFAALEDLEQTKNIKKEYFIEALESALTSAYKKNFGEAKSAFVKLSPEKNTIKIYAYKTIVDEVDDPDKEISLADAKLIKKSYKVGDTVQEEVSTKDFGRIAAQTARQVIMQKIREAERSNLMTDLTDKEGEIITGVLRREDNGTYFFEIGQTSTEGVLGPKDQIPGEKLKLGDRVKLFVRKIKDDFRGPQVQVSRTSALFVKKLFELEVPELTTGEVEIKNIVREAGYRTKMAVYAENQNIDPIGACVGNNGMRVNAVVDELCGEKIDIIPYSDIPEEYIAAAISPARAISVEIDELNHSAEVVVPKDKLSLAIGKTGQNVRLAAKLTNWKIDVKPAAENVEEKGEEEIALEAKDKKFKSISVDSSDENLDDIFGDID